MNTRNVIIILFLVVALVLLLSPLITKLPDTLEKMAQEKKSLDKERALLNSPLAGYALAGIKNKKLATAFAGICGIATVFLLTYSVAALLRKKKKT